jgi:hypothetical protein
VNYKTSSQYPEPGIEKVTHRIVAEGKRCVTYSHLIIEDTVPVPRHASIDVQVTSDASARGRGADTFATFPGIVKWTVNSDEIGCDLLYETITRNKEPDKIIISHLL